MRSSLALVAITLLAGCATTRTATTVRRPADVVLPSGDPIALHVRSTCRDIAVGLGHRRVVEKGQTEILGLQVETRQVHRERVGDVRECPGDGLDASLKQRLVQAASGALKRAGHRVVVGGARGERVELKVEVDRVRDIEFIGQRTDPKGDDTCQKLCGSKACDEYRIKGEVAVRARLEGPLLGGERQGNSLDFEAGALRGGASDRTMRRFVCRRRDAVREWRDARRYDWARAYRAVTGRIVGEQIHRAFLPFTERYDVALFDTVESTLNDEGVGHGRVGRWEAALGAFEKALDSLGPDADAVARGRVQHNIAAARMMLGRLDPALESVRAAEALAHDTESRILRVEIQRRIRDRKRMSAAPASRRAAR